MPVDWWLSIYNMYRVSYPDLFHIRALINDTSAHELLVIIDTSLLKPLAFVISQLIRSANSIGSSGCSTPIYTHFQSGIIDAILRVCDDVAKCNLNVGAFVTIYIQSINHYIAPLMWPFNRLLSGTRVMFEQNIDDKTSFSLVQVHSWCSLALWRTHKSMAHRSRVRCKTSGLTGTSPLHFHSSFNQVLRHFFIRPHRFSSQVYITRRYITYSTAYSCREEHRPGEQEPPCQKPTHPQSSHPISRLRISFAPYNIHCFVNTILYTYI